MNYKNFIYIYIKKKKKTITYTQQKSPNVSQKINKIKINT